MLIETRALVLKSFPYSDTSLISRIYTEDRGKVSVLAKGARRMKNNVAALLEPLNIVDISYYDKESRGIQTLKEVSAQTIVSRIREDYDKLTLALVVSDILDHTTHEHDPNPILYRLATRTIIEMEATTESGRTLFWFFLLQLAIRTGFKPNLHQCGRCNEPIKNGILDRTSGALCCHRCLSDGDIRLNSEQLTYLQTMNEYHIDQVGNLHIQDELTEGISRFLLSFVSYHLEGMEKVKSLKLIEQHNK
ncbi:MAG: DNA repair protein RecO [Candidatus Marinimicrobia bacterium]|nr:DNA repair protein RecO [Candidatus Neomarinimicrobiota bacterium]